MIEKRKGISSPKYISKMHKNQINSICNSSTPVNNKTSNTSYKVRAFASRENEEQVF